MTRQVDFHRYAQNGRVTIQDFRSQSEIFKAVLYVQKIWDLAKKLELDNFPEIDPHVTPGLENQDDVNTQLFMITRYLDQIEVEFLHEINGRFSDGYLALPDDWRDRAQTHLHYIHDLVTKAEMNEKLRARLLERLHGFGAELDRKRTRVQDALLLLGDFCEAVGEGAKKLEPAVKLVERLVGAFQGLRRIEQEGSKEAPALPSPDDLMLSDLRNEESQAPSKE